MRQLTELQAAMLVGLEDRAAVHAAWALMQNGLCDCGERLRGHCPDGCDKAARPGSLPAHLLTPRDWQLDAVRRGAELLGTPEGAALLAEARRYGALADEVDRLRALVERLTTVSDADVSYLDVAAQLVAASRECGSWEGHAELLRRAAGVINQQSIDRMELDQICRRDVGRLFGMPNASAAEVRQMVRRLVAEAERGPVVKSFPATEQGENRAA